MYSYDIECGLDGEEARNIRKYQEKYATRGCQLCSKQQCKTFIRHVLMCGSEPWALKEAEQNLLVRIGLVMIMLRWMTGINIGVRANIHLGGQTGFCPPGERKLFVTRPRQGDKIIMNYCRAYFLTIVE